MLFKYRNDPGQKKNLEKVVKVFREQRIVVQNQQSPEFYTENYMEKIGIDTSHLTLYIDDLIEKQKEFIQQKRELYEKLLEYHHQHFQSLRSNDMYSGMNINVKPEEPAISQSSASVITK